MDVVSARVTPSGTQRPRPVPADFLPAAATGFEGSLQAFENLYENTRNTNVIKVTERCSNSRENINLIWLLCRPNGDARRRLEGPVLRGFPGCPGGPAGVKDRLLQCRKLSAIRAQRGAAP